MSFTGNINIIATISFLHYIQIRLENTLFCVSYESGVAAALFFIFKIKQHLPRQLMKLQSAKNLPLLHHQS